jgi:pilus assembly protein CpaB
MARHFGGIGPYVEKERTTRVLVSAGVVVVLVLLAFAFFFLYYGSSTDAGRAVVVERNVPEPGLRLVDVLIPIEQIEAGSPLEPTMFRRDQRPAVAVNPRVVKDFEEIKGQWARSLIVAGQPLQREYVTSVRPTNAIAPLIPEGHRAVAISVNAISGVEGWARAGAKVDVVWASRIRGQPGVTVIVQNAKVLSAERQVEGASQPGAPIPSTVTLLVTAEDAQKIQLAQTTGSLSLSLRGDNDPGKGEAALSITIADLLGGNSDDPVGAIRMRQGKVKIGDDEYFLDSAGKLVPSTNDGGKQ